MKPNCIDLKNVTTLLAFIALFQSGYSQDAYEHEIFYDYLRKDIKVIESKLRKEKSITHVFKEKYEKDSLIIAFTSKSQKNYYTLFFIQDTCRYIGVRRLGISYETMLQSFRSRYAELNARDMPGYFEDYKDIKHELVAYFEDITMNIGYHVMKIDDEIQNDSIFFFCSLFDNDL